jgi:hypothetical protein
MKQAEDNKTIDMFDEIRALNHHEMMHRAIVFLIHKQIQEADDAEVPSRSRFICSNNIQEG